MRWHTAAEAGWSPIDHVFSAVRLSVDPTDGHRMRGKDLVIFRVKGKHKNSHIRLKFEEISERRIVASFSVEDGNGKTTVRKISLNPSDGEDNRITDAHFATVYQDTRTNKECGTRLGKSASWVSRHATKLRKKGVVLRRESRPPDTMNVYGKTVLTKRFVHAWNRCPDLDAVITHLGLGGAGERNKVKSRLSIMATRFRDAYGIEMKTYPRGRRAKKAPRIQPKPLLPPMD
jgi:hypothetical protein